MWAHYIRKRWGAEEGGWTELSPTSESSATLNSYAARAEAFTVERGDIDSKTRSYE